jgi:hypothetical protein
MSIKFQLNESYTDKWDEYKCIHIDEISAVLVCTKDNQEEDRLNRPCIIPHTSCVKVIEKESPLSYAMWERFAQEDDEEPVPLFQKI